MGKNDYVRILRRSWLLIVAAALLGVVAAWAVTSRTAPTYEATSAAFVSSERSGTLNDLTQGNAFTEKRVASYAQLATEPMVTQPVIDDFNLGVTPGAFAQRVTVSVPVDTTMIVITVSDGSPTVAASLANAMMTSLKATVAEIEPKTVAVTAPDGTVVSAAGPPVKITQVRFAEAPVAAASPNLLLNLAVGLLAGLALGVLAAILRDLIDTRVRSLDEVESMTDVPVVGIIPDRPKNLSATDLGGGDPGNAFGESFRILRTNLQFLDVDRPATFVVSSPGGGDGKSTVTANLAASIAANGSRVLVVDADLRRPQVHETFGVEGGAGLTDILIGRAEFADVVQRWRSERLHVLASGRIPPNPSELLGSAHMREFMAQVQDRYDVVLYDTAPVLPVPDAAILSRSVGGVLLVAAVGQSKREQLRGAIDALQKVNARISGIVANRLSVRGSNAYLAESYHSWTTGDLVPADASSDGGKDAELPDPHRVSA